MEEIILELKQAIIEELNLEDIKPGDIDTKAPLFGDGLGLDSIDALEIIIILEKKYGIKIDKPAEAKEVFFSIETLANFVSANKK